MQAAGSGYEGGRILYMALELSNRTWRLGFSNGTKMRQKSVEARALERVVEEIALAKHKLTISNINAFMMNAIADPRQPYWHPSWIEPDPHYRAIRREPGRVERRERECRRRQAQCARAGFAVDVGRLLGNSSLGLEGRGIGSRREYQLADIVSAS